MHSLSPYLLRCFDSNLQGNLEDRYCVLNKIGSSDAYELIKAFTQKNSSNFIDIEKSKQVYRFSGFVYDDNLRIAYGWLELGSYGIRSDIIDVNTGKVDFRKAQNNAEIIRHFSYFFIPVGFNEGLALLHSFRGNGVKTVFLDQFGQYFSTKTQLNLQMNPLSYEKALEQWIDGNAKEIRLVKFVGNADIADQIRSLGHDEQDLILKPPRKGTLGSLKDLLNPKSEQSKAIEFLAPLCAQVKTVIEIEGRKRVFRIGASSECEVCSIEAPDSLVLDGGIPTDSGMQVWCTEIAREFAKTLYPGLGVSP